jgi:hypothetical protein
MKNQVRQYLLLQSFDMSSTANGKLKTSWETGIGDYLFRTIVLFPVNELA